jgi:hypothetical protein
LDAVAAGKQVAVNALQQLKFPSYDLFSHAALNLEIKSRDAQLQAEGAHLFPRVLDAAPDQEFRDAAYCTGVKTYDQIDGLFKHLDGFVEFARGLQDKAAEVLEIAEMFRLHAFNVTIASEQFGGAGGCVGVVGGFLSDYARQLTEGTVELREHIGDIAQGAETISARVAMARLQFEMLLFFQAECATQRVAVETGSMQILEECFVTSTTQVVQALTQLRDNLPRLLESRKTLARTAMAIEMTQVCGLTEAARILDGVALRSMFTEFRAKISSTRAHLDDLSQVIDNISFISSNSPRQVTAINSALQDTVQQSQAVETCDAERFAQLN